MLKTFATACGIFLGLSLTAQARAQARPTATATAAFQAGGGYTIANPDYGQKNIQGISFFTDYDFGLHVGLEGDIHLVQLVHPTAVAEDSYMVGPRGILPYRRFKFYGKGLLGVGDLKVYNPYYNVGHQSGYFFGYALGGGVEYSATDHIIIRAIDIERHTWPGYVNGLTPTMYTFGVAYHFYR
jgi:opacity protein-like surface antigen